MTSPRITLNGYLIKRDGETIGRISGRTGAITGYRSTDNGFVRLPGTFANWTDAARTIAGLAR